MALHGRLLCTRCPRSSLRAFDHVVPQVAPPPLPALRRSANFVRSAAYEGAHAIFVDLTPLEERIFDEVALGAADDVVLRTFPENDADGPTGRGIDDPPAHCGRRGRPHGNTDIVGVRARHASRLSRGTGIVQ